MNNNVTESSTINTKPSPQAAKQLSDNSQTIALPNIYNMHSNSKYDNMDLATLESLLKERQEEMKREKILSNYKIGQLPSGKYWVRISGKLVQRKELKDLEDFLIALNDENEITINSIWDSFLESRKLDCASTTYAKDIRNYNDYIKSSDLAKMPIKNIKLKDGKAFVNHCLKIKLDMKYKYWQNIYTTLMAIMKYAIIDEEIRESNPLTYLKPHEDLFVPKTFKEDKELFFSDEEMKQVCQMAYDDALSTKNALPLGIIFLFHIAIRVGELCALKWKDVDDNSIHIQRELRAKVDKNGKSRGREFVEHPKTKSSNRYIELSNQSLIILQKIKEFNNNNGIPTNSDDFVFIRVKKGNVTFCTERCFDIRLRKYQNKLGFEEIKSCHDIRRTTLTNLFFLGMNEKEVQQVAGHSDVNMTRKYIKNKNTNKKDYLDKIALSCSLDMLEKSS